jgi:glycosyltransferase involved in cell wall biosynthesis
VSLIIDMSPSAINRTAMYHISLDIAMTLREQTIGFRYFGDRYDEQPKSAELNDARKRLGDLVNLAERRDLEGLKSIQRSFERDGTPGVSTLYLDPLYVLFGQLSEADSVLLLDMSTISNPEWHSPGVGLLYELAFAKITQSRPKLIAISQNTADAYVANFGYPRRPIQVVHLYVPEHLRAAAETAPSFHPSHPYFLFVGSLESRKNVIGAIEGFRVSKLGTNGYQLLIAGGQGHGSLKIQQLVSATANVFLRGFVDNDELHSLYTGATGFVYPSYLEGFGVPLLEALMYGIPAVASVSGACPEVGGDVVAYVDPDDHAGIAAELIRIATLSPGERSLNAARSRAWVGSQFTFTAFQDNIRRAVLHDE